MDRVNRTIGLTILMVFVLLVSVSAVAGDRNVPDSNGESADVIAHLALSGAPATQMFIRTQSGSEYLYIDQGTRRGMTIVDISRPSHPAVVGHVSWPDGSAAGDLRFLGSGLALSQGPQTAPVRPTPATLNILDVSNPGHPAVLRTFSGVTSALPERARNLVFVANNDGLWIVRHRVTQSAYAARHQCTSEDAISPLPDCY